MMTLAMAEGATKKLWEKTDTLMVLKYWEAALQDR
jgi:hypothetical protein